MFRLQHDLGICILECESRHELSISRGVGHSLKIMQGSTGKAMLAFMDPPRQAEFLSGLPANAARTRLEKSLKAARRNGYATSRGEIFVGAVAVSAPYFDHRGSVVGSVGLYGPEARINETRCWNIPSWFAKPAGKYRSCLVSRNREVGGLVRRGERVWNRMAVFRLTPAETWLSK